MTVRRVGRRPRPVPGPPDAAPVYSGQVASDVDLLTRIAKALAHPLRREILHALAAEEEMRPRDIAEILQTGLENLAYHARLLEQLGMVQVVRETKVRGAIAHHFGLTADGERALPVLGELEAVVGEDDDEARGMASQVIAASPDPD